MQSRLLKTIRATQVTRSVFADPPASLTDEEQRALGLVVERFGAELELRAAGLTPQEIRKLEFARWLAHNR